MEKGSSGQTSDCRTLSTAKSKLRKTRFAGIINSPTFGQIITQANTNRVMQFALRYQF
jgi:hypothetical protein